MQLVEIAVGYRESEQKVKERLKDLKLARSRSKSSGDRSRIDAQITQLTAIRRECQAIAVLCERYYEKGYRRNEKYTV